MRFLLIVVIAVIAAVFYGIVHDQITIRVCLEYFTIFHPRVIDSQDPTLLGLVWGVLATWWVGAILGVGIAIAARVGRWPKRCAKSFVRSFLWLLLAMGCIALLAGILGYVFATEDLVVLHQPWATLIPEASHDRFLANLWAHSASYYSGFLCGVAIIVRTVLQRRTLAKGMHAGSVASN